MRPPQISWRRWRRSCRPDAGPARRRTCCTPSALPVARRVSGRGRARRPAPCSSSGGAAGRFRRCSPASGARTRTRSPSSIRTPAGPRRSSWQRRQRLAAAILANPNTGAAGRAADVLRSASVDARLLGLLAALVAQLGSGVGRLPAAPRRTGRRPPRPATCSSTASDGDRRPGEAATDRLVEFLQAQLPPFAPDDVEVTDDGVLVGSATSPRRMRWSTRTLRDRDTPQRQVSPRPTG